MPLEKLITKENEQKFLNRIQTIPWYDWCLSKDIADYGLFGTEKIADIIYTHISDYIVELRKDNRNCYSIKVYAEKRGLLSEYYSENSALKEIFNEFEYAIKNKTRPENSRKKFEEMLEIDS